MTKKNLLSVGIWIFLIILLAGFIRFYKLDKIPVSLYWDEISQGYNAYSISSNLKDEYGNFLPILFRAFNDYKMPLNIYLTALSVKAFGLSDFSVRLPSALLGTLTVFIVFFLVRSLIDKSGWALGQKYKNIISLISSFLLAISPWHLQFSRAAFEANVALFFVVLGAYLFIKGLDKYKFFLLSLLSFSLACYGYRSADVFLPLFITALFIIWRKELIKFGLQKIGLGIAVFILLIIPLFYQLINEGSSRFNQTSISTKVNEIALDNYKKGIDTNRKVLYVKIFVENYMSQFNPNFLFISGDSNVRHSPQGMGMLYLWEMPFLLIGLYVVFKHFNIMVKASITAWTIAASLPAALSIPVPHALRFLNVLPIPQLIVALGIFYAFILLNKNLRKIYLAILIITIILSFVRYVNIYNISNAKNGVADWADGYRQLTEYVFAHEVSYDKVIISGHYWEPYIYLLFYKKFDPKIYQKSGTSNSFGKYIFGGTSWDKEKNSQELGNVNLRELAKTKNNLLVVLSPEEYELQKDNIGKYLTEIKNHNDEAIFIVGEVK